MEMFMQKEPKVTPLDGAKIIPAYEVDDLMQFMNESEQQSIEREKDYNTKGPGRIENIINTEMDKLMGFMKEKMNKQDEEFISKQGPGKKWFHLIVH